MRRAFDILLRLTGIFFSLTTVAIVIAALVTLRFYLLIMAFVYAVLGLICIDNLKMIQDNGYGLYMLDKELGARTYTQAAPLASAQ